MRYGNTLKTLPLVRISSQSTRKERSLFPLRFFGSSGKHCSYRRAYRLVLAMNTANPTTRSPFSFFEFTDQPFDVLLSRFVLLYGNNPADPLVPSERCKVLPACQCRPIGSEEIGRAHV